jgi:hypothetical protein
MAGAVGARLKGDEYQHLSAWGHALELLLPQRQVASVIVEDAKALSADDVTLLRADGSYIPDTYHQIKYHVDHRDGYSVETLTAAETGQSSLVTKWFRSWERLLTNRPGRRLEIEIVSNWGWTADDDLRALVDDSGALKDEFFTATGRKKAADLRKTLADHVGAAPDAFEGFARTLRFTFGFSNLQKVAQQVSERMEHQGLKHDDNALTLAIGIVRQWIMDGRQEVTRADLEAVIGDRDLWLPEETKPSVNVYLSTIKSQKFDIDPDYHLDWREYFVGDTPARGHETRDPGDWNGKMMPALRAFEERVSSETNKRLIRARGKARLSAWLAFGWTFSDVAGYTIEAEQRDQFWQTNTPPNADFTLKSNGPDGERLDTEGETVAVGLSITGDIEADVRRHLVQRPEKVRAALFIHPARGPSPDAVRNSGDATALAIGAKQLMWEFATRQRAKRLLLYYMGPAGGACFIGHRLNAVCRDVQIMEHTNPGYIPSFTLPVVTTDRLPRSR